VKIEHHLDEATIIAYAAGTLDEALAVVAAAHAAWCPSCRAAIGEAEALGGSFLSEIDGEGISAACRERTLARLEGAVLYRLPQSRPRMSDLPGPLARLLSGGGLDDIRWRRLAPGVAKAQAKLSPGARGKVHFLRIAPGKAMPEHGHGGEELTMVLSGSYRDRFGRFGRGDIADLDEEIEHKPVADGEEPCICVVATVAPTRFKPLVARLLQPLAGI
jgi:putative transcriptional regulator